MDAHPIGLFSLGYTTSLVPFLPTLWWIASFAPVAESHGVWWPLASTLRVHHATHAFFPFLSLCLRVSMSFLSILVLLARHIERDERFGSWVKASLSISGAVSAGAVLDVTFDVFIRVLVVDPAKVDNLAHGRLMCVFVLLICVYWFYASEVLERYISWRVAGVSCFVWILAGWVASHPGLLYPASP